LTPLLQGHTLAAPVAEVAIAVKPAPALALAAWLLLALGSVGSAWAMASITALDADRFQVLCLLADSIADAEVR
jgi:hypothetical protein